MGIYSNTDANKMERSGKHAEAIVPEPPGNG